MDASFVKLPHCGPKPCFLLTQLKEEGKEGFELALTDGDHFWEGQVTEEDLDANSSNLDMDFTTYVKKTAAAFTRRNMGEMNFAYQLKAHAGGDGVDFLWKQEVGDIKNRLGTATLHQQKAWAKALTSMFTSCISMATEQQRKMETLEADNQRLAQERDDALKRLDKCVHAKEELEQDLYSKFVAVLNSKKEKIRNLRENGGDSVESAPDAPVPSTSTEAASDHRGKRKTPFSRSSPSQNTSEPAGSSSQEGEDRDTDDETPPRARRQAPVSRVSRNKADCSLNLGDEEEEERGKKGNRVVRRPARQRGGNKRQTPSKPVLPKVSSKSSDSGPKTPRRGSVRRSGSGHSDRSMDNVDTDDLLNNF